MFNVYKISNAEPIDFAAEELKKYLRMMRPEAGDVKISFNKEKTDGFRLGLMSDFGLDTSDVEDVNLDDIIYIDTKKNTGIIAGSNPRSVLFAVYEFLKQNGCAFYFPGKDGEYIPMSATTDARELRDVKYRFVPTTRYRGQSLMHQHPDTDYVDFLAKLYMNTTMIEFKIPVVPTEYSHSLNTENYPAESITREEILQVKRRCEAEVAKRGLQMHDIGHGFIFDAFVNSPTLSSNSYSDENVPDEVRQYLAELDGKRGIHSPYIKSTLFTNFCMSNPEARGKVIDYVCNYSETHSNITHLHVWLADGHNNYCECENCRKKNPSDWYMILMNELDSELTKRNNDMKIVFVSYVDTLWAPLKEKIKNSKRFSLLFAPIFRSYSKTLPEPLPEVELPPYEYNKSENPTSFYEALLHLKKWENAFPGDKISFEYRFWRVMPQDISGLEVARRVYEDARAYEKFGVAGVIECGSPCTFFPTGLGYYVYAKTLYNKNLTFDEIVEEYLFGIFGEDWKKIYDIFTKIADVFPYDYICTGSAKRRPNGYLSKEKAEAISKIADVVAEEKRFVEEHYNSDRRVRTMAVRLLEKHIEFVTLMSEVFLAKAKGENEKALKLFEEARVKFGRHEAVIGKYFNHAHYFGTLGNCARLVLKDSIFTV